jgi:hypothetical protein
MSSSVKGFDFPVVCSVLEACSLARIAISTGPTRIFSSPPTDRRTIRTHLGIALELGIDLPSVVDDHLQVLVPRAAVSPWISMLAKIASTSLSPWALWTIAVAPRFSC